MQRAKVHFAILDGLRAVAAIAVCLFHFNYRNGGTLSSVLEYGNYGVEIFFVISGFVIPLAMSRSKFGYRDTGNFLLRRTVRLYPVFAIIALATLPLMIYGNPLLGYGGDSPDLTWSRALANFTLTANLVGESWYLPVFWTLAIEMQYYILIAISFPLLTHRRGWVRGVAILLWICASYLVERGETVFSWTAFFAMGILVFLYREKKMGRFMFWALLTLAAFSHQETRGITSAGVGFCTVLCILLNPEIRAQWVLKLGTISYSLYLLHLALGGAVLTHLGFGKERWPWMAGQLLGVILAMVVSIGGALLLYSWVELPIHHKARSFKTRARKKELARGYD